MHRTFPSRLHWCGAVSVLVGVLLAPAAAAPPARPAAIGPRLQRLWSDLDSRTPVAAWVFLRDKGTTVPSVAPQSPISPRALARRLKMRPADRAIDTADLPLDEAAVNQVGARVERIRQRSKWFNALSVEATRPQLDALLRLQCVRGIELVARARRAADPGVGSAEAGAGGTIAVPGITAAPAGSAIAARFDYGRSLGQLQIIRVVDLHNLGYDGHGVLVAHFDDGYRLAHEALAGLDIVDAWDFVDNDPDPAPAPSCMPECGFHGISTLSVLGGFKPGQLIGAAFGASYLLARTENDASETPLEEDNWVAAAEWADSAGADIISSSVGYREYEAPFRSLTWADMDGNTTLITRAADMAVARGILVVQGVGNDGVPSGTPPPNTLVAPADGDSVIAVGAVDASGSLSPFTSWGPTVDGRTKPDILAQGPGTWTALGSGTAAYGSGFGTSIACPMVAGAAALLLEAFPSATPLEIRDALRGTASRAASPDRYAGWGIIDALAALRYLVERAPPSPNPYANRPSRPAPNPYPFALRPIIRYELPVAAQVTVQIHDVRGRLVRRLLSAPQAAEKYAIEWDGRDDRGQPAGRGVYVARLEARAIADPGRVLVLIRKVPVLR